MSSTFKPSSAFWVKAPPITTRGLLVTCQIRISLPNTHIVATHVAEVTHIRVTNLVPMSPNFTPFHSTTSRFRLQAILRQVHQMTPKWHWTIQDQMYPIYVLVVYSSIKFQSFSFYDLPFLSYRQYWDNSTEWPQNYLEHYMVTVLYST